MILRGWVSLGSAREFKKTGSCLCCFFSSADLDRTSGGLINEKKNIKIAVGELEMGDRGFASQGTFSGEQLELGQ